MSETLFTHFKQSIAAYSLPERFTYPFCYEPHPLCQLAAKELQFYIETRTDWQHDFSLIGKMFGVLLVRNKQGEVGYLSAFSGKLADSNHHPNFVPPVFDMRAKDGLFSKEQQQVLDISEQIKAIEFDPELAELKQRLQAEQDSADEKLTALRVAIIAGRKHRKQQRRLAEQRLDTIAIEQIMAQLSRESIKQKKQLQDEIAFWTERIEQIQKSITKFTDEIARLKNKRKQCSATLQQKLFEQYQFLNQNGVKKSVYAIFKNTRQQTPPAGAGECATPKLLHYAFRHKLTPLAMAEFWWGASPKSQIRQHKKFYAACLGKCQPILEHMLEGVALDDNPLVYNLSQGKKIDIIYQDADMVVIHKPADFLSVPGKHIKDSVYLRMKQQFPSATGSLIVHRLDMSTSGLMVIALSKHAHKVLQQQFIHRTVKKRYVALLEGVLSKKNGIIKLPLRVDLEDRPRQLVCYHYGKPAETHWDLIEQKNGRSKVYFYPKTGRTHQLRVHAAHVDGLNRPIVGDDLYGHKADRLYLHAESLSFVHPRSGEAMHFQVDASFQ